MVFFIISVQGIMAQPDLRNSELDLQKISCEIIRSADDSVRNQLNESLSDRLARMLKNPKSFNYDFDSLTFLSKLSPDDKQFRIYTWELNLSDGSRKCSGILQLPTGNDSCRVFVLRDISGTQQGHDHMVYGPELWFGAVYYKIIRHTAPDGNIIYTMLGRNANIDRVTRKVIEILSFDSAGEPRFGSQRFPQKGDGRLTRIIFSFSSSVSMVLRYEPQHLVKKGNWNPRKKTFRNTESKQVMIVCDHLVPADPIMEGIYEYYIPAAETHDGYIYQKGNWVFVPDIMARNK